jgi:hypothetical protein
MTPHEKGTIVAGWEIVKTTVDAGTVKGTKYLVRELCCGRESSKSHAAIDSAVAYNRKSCPKCKIKKGVKRGPNRPKDMERPYCISVIEANGHRWYKLGKMGPRFAPNEFSPETEDEQWT